MSIMSTMSDKASVFTQLLDVFPNANRIRRAIRVYERKYSKTQYNIEIITEIIIRLEIKDKKSVGKHAKKRSSKAYKLKANRSEKDMFIGKQYKNGPNLYRPSPIKIESVSCPSSIFSSDDDDIFGKPGIMEKLSFVPHLNMTEADTLCINNDIDYRRDDGKFVGAKILNKEEKKLLICYNGMNKENAFWSDYNKDLHRFAIYGSISDRKSLIINNNNNNNLKIGDNVYIYPKYQNSNINEWIIGYVIQFDIGQCQISYHNKYDNKRYYFWSHLDNYLELKIIENNNKKNGNNDKVLTLETFSNELLKMNWSLDLNTNKMGYYGDNNSLFRCIAKEIYNDYKLFNRVKNEYNEYKQENKNYFNYRYNQYIQQQQRQQQGNYINFSDYDLIRIEDKMDIEILCELYNVRIKIYEIYCNTLNTSFDSVDIFHYEHTFKLPLIILSLPYKYEFYIINNPNRLHQPPLINNNNNNNEQINSIRNKRLLKTNDLFRFLYDLFNYFDIEGKYELKMNEISNFILSSDIDDNILNKIKDVIIGPNNNKMNLNQFISFMNLIYITQKYDKLPSKYGQLLNDMNLDYIYNGINNNNNNIKIANMSYPINNPFDIIISNNNEIDDIYNGIPYNELKLSMTELTASPPPSSSYNISPFDEEGKDEFAITNKILLFDENNNNNNLNMKQYEFKKYFDLNMNIPNKQYYYNKFIQCGYNDIEVLIYLDINILINECNINKGLSQLFMTKINDLKVSHIRFKKFIIHTLEMEEYWPYFCNVGVVTFCICYQRIKNYKDIIKIIGDENKNDAQIIFNKLPKNQRRKYNLSSISKNDNNNDNNNNNNNNDKLPNHPQTKYI